MGEEEEKWLFSASGSQKVQRMIRHRVGPIAVEENFPVLGVERLQHFVGVSQSGGQVPFSDVTGFVTGFF